MGQYKSADYQRNYQREYYRERRRKGLCGYCGAEPDPGYATCRTCRDRKTALNTKWKRTLREQRRIQGLCPRCGCNPIAPGQSSCIKHYLMNMARTHLGHSKFWKDLLAIYNQQDGLCYYSGLPVTLGINASVDHKKPRSIYPELRYDINNIAWSLDYVNHMKCNVEIEVFITICQAIVMRNNT